jgi:signal transduction histidine kinase
VEAMGGSVAAEPAPGGGARLVVRLPTRSLPAPRPP